MRDDHTKHAAFAIAAEALFEEYPLPGEANALRRLERIEFIMNAGDGLYIATDEIPVGMLAVPPDELFAIHALIYG